VSVQRSTLVLATIAALGLLRGAWMTFDGLRALIVGDYVTASSGPYAGRLGVWANVVAAVGVDPRSTFMRLVFVVLGASTLLAMAAFVARVSWGRGAAALTAVAAIWFAPFGTFTAVAQLILLVAAGKGRS
jgi:hypothetical protein